jgi:hypothetical protein
MRLTRLVYVVALTAVLVVFSVIDIDGDQTTTNLPSIALSCSVDLDGEQPAGNSGSRLDNAKPRALRARLRRRLQRWDDRRQEELDLHALFIRGP